MSTKRRDFLRNVTLTTLAGAGLSVFPSAIRRALAVAPRRVTGTIQDVDHVVVLMQENRSFDHYFGTMRGVRGFGDRFPIPVPGASGTHGKTVWFQPSEESPDKTVAPFHLDTLRSFEYMRVEGTPHSMPDAQLAWGEGKMHEWPRHKSDHSMGYFREQDIPFQFALADAFTLCDAYHCSMHAGTNPNRCFLWTGTNDPLRLGQGPVVDNAYDHLEHDPEGGYSWLTYCERLQAAGVSWQVYQDMNDNFTDNPLSGFRRFRAAHRNERGSLPALKERGLSTRDLDQLEDDVLSGKLPEVSWIVATAAGSEHPGPSSPAQGAEYTSRVLDALTADPDVWARTVLFINFDENDGFFDHVPPPAPPSLVRTSARTTVSGASTVDTRGEYHEFLPDKPSDDQRALLHRPYGLGPRVPMYVVSPWSKGGWVDSQVFDHTSVIRFMEGRFGVFEPNISPWRRAVCGDLTSAFDFGLADHGDFARELPDTSELAERARAIGDRSTPPTPNAPALPTQEPGLRLSRALPYELHVHARARASTGQVELAFLNTGRAAAVFHVYDRMHLERVPRRYTVEGGRALTGRYPVRDDAGAYDLWVLGPSGFHRHFTGRLDAALGHALQPEIEVSYDRARGDVHVQLFNPGLSKYTFELTANAYFQGETWTYTLKPWRSTEHRWSLENTAHWYDFTVHVRELPAFARRFAGRVETGRHSFSDPALGAEALGEPLSRVAR